MWGAREASCTDLRTPRADAAFKSSCCTWHTRSCHLTQGTPWGRDLLLLRFPASGFLLLGRRPGNAQCPPGPPPFSPLRLPDSKDGAWDLAGNLAANFQKKKKKKKKILKPFLPRMWVSE